MERQGLEGEFERMFDSVRKTRDLIPTNSRTSEPGGACPLDEEEPGSRVCSLFVETLGLRYLVADTSFRSFDVILDGSLLGCSFVGGSVISSVMSHRERPDRYIQPSPSSDLRIGLISRN